MRQGTLRGPVKAGPGARAGLTRPASRGVSDSDLAKGRDTSAQGLRALESGARVCPVRNTPRMLKPVETFLSCAGRVLPSVPSSRSICRRCWAIELKYSKLCSISS